MRKCVGCGEMKNKKEMLRVLKTPENVVVLDDTGRKNGTFAFPRNVFRKRFKAKA